ncbi:ankyrin repeat-containing domain protein [Baffinella frigidus]|nr:ankyrin repeat-containing domain protein [Cryptophyta sp. CCMP2293]
MADLERVPLGGERGGPAPDPTTLFLYHARGGRTAELERMISEKVVLNCDVYEAGIGVTALHICAERGDNASVALLLKHDARASRSVPGSLDTPMHMAAREGFAGTLAVFKEHGVDMHAGATETVRFLLTVEGVRDSAGNRFGMTPVMLASIAGQEEVLKELLLHPSHREVARDA